MKKLFLFVIGLFLVVISATSFLLLTGQAYIALPGTKKSTVRLSEFPSDLIIAPPRYDYTVVSIPAVVQVQPGEEKEVTVTLRNTGNTAWLQGSETPFYLGPSRPRDRESVFYREGAYGWQSANRIKMQEEVVRPGELATAVFTLTAPKKAAIYKEYFRPVIDSVEWLTDRGAVMEVHVGDTAKAGVQTLVNGRPSKYILVDLSEQRLKAYENGLEKYSFVTSTGRIGMDTPVGEYRIHNKAGTAYSEPYDLYMDNWMAFTPDGVYGLHSLPYWKLKKGGRLYEGADHLGTRVSHGCIRTGVDQSKLLFNWTEVGTAVIITD